MTRRLLRGNRTLMAAASGIALALGSAACERHTDAMTPERLSQRGALAVGYTDDLPVADGSVRGAMVPVTLADGRRAQLFIPNEAAMETVSVRSLEDVQPVRVSTPARRATVTRSTRPAARRTVAAAPRKRSWEKEVLIVGGSAGAGTLIGALAGGQKGAGIGAAAGGIGGLVYDLATRNK